MTKGIVALRSALGADRENCRSLGSPRFPVKTVASAHVMRLSTPAGMTTLFEVKDFTQEANKRETGASLSAAYPTQAQKQGLNGAPNVRCR
jgi:hypothetical protein